MKKSAETNGERQVTGLRLKVTRPRAPRAPYFGC